VTIGRPVASLATGRDGGGGLPTNPSALLGSGSLDLAQAGVHRLVVDLGVGTAHDRVDLVLSHLSPLAETAAGTPLQVGLALEGDPVAVLATEVLRNDDAPGGRHLVALAPSHRLSRLHLGRSYLQQTVADVVNDLLGEAEVDAGEIDAPWSLPSYHVESRRPAWDNLHRLAALFGAEITSDAEGAVCFAPAPGASTGGLGGLASAAASVAGALGLGEQGGLRRGANVLAWVAGERGAAPDPTPAVAPLGAASPYGAPRGHHLLKASDGERAPTIVSPSLRDSDGASSAATALSAAAERRRTGGRLVVVGDPTLRAACDISVDGDRWHVRSVRHVVDGGGYRCDLLVEGAA
jgi:hypothetical protein